MEESQSPKYPGAPPTSDRRLNPRFPVRPIEYVEIGRTNGGIILDISREGMAVAAAQVIPGDQTLHFRFQLPRFPETIEAIAEITWIGETGKRAGFRFVNLPPRPRKQILDWITLQHANAAAANTGAVSQQGPTTVSDSRVPHTSPSSVGTLPSSPTTPRLSVPAVHQPEAPSNGKRPPVDRRSQSRKTLHSSTYLQFDDGNAGLLGDLSVAGLSFRAARSLSNDDVIVTFQLPGSDQNIEAPAAIVWKSASGKKAGARFTSIPHEAKNRISDWIHSRTPPAAAPSRPDSSSPSAHAASVNPTSIPTDLEPEYRSSTNGNSTHPQISSPDLPAASAATANVEPPPLPPPPTFRTSIFETTSLRAASTNLVTPVAPVLPPLSAEAYYYVAPKQSPSFLKVLGAMILLGGICFGAGFFYSRNHQTLLPTFTAANSEPRRTEVPNGDSDTERAAANPLSTSPVIPAPSEDPAVKDPATNDISNSPEANRNGETTSQFQKTQTATQSPSTLSTSSQPNSSKADIEPSPSGRTSSPKERAATRDTASDIKSSTTTSRVASSFVPPPTSTTSNPSTATSTLPAYRASNSTPNHSQLQQPQQTPPSSHASTASPTANTPVETKLSTNFAASQLAPTSSNLNSSRPVTPPSPSAAAPTSATAPVTPPTVQHLTGSVSFFCRFRAIRNAPDPANRAAGAGVLQLGPLLSSPLPAYPADAERKQIQGVVELDVFVAADGSVQEVHFIKGPAELADAALDAVRSWHYGSTVLGGRPVETEQSIFLTFKLGK
jgi:periplasmic protein TonB